MMMSRLFRDLTARSTSEPAAGRAALAVVALVVAVQTPGVHAQCPQYEVTAIIQGPECGSLGFGNTSVFGLNSLGEVAGFYLCPLGDPQAFKWSQDTGIVWLETPEWMPSGATPKDIADDGTIVGTFNKPTIGARAFIYRDGVWTEIPPVDPESGHSFANAVSPDGRYVVGRRSIASEVVPHNAFIYDAEDQCILDLGVMNGPNSEAEDVSATGYVAGWTGLQSSSVGTSPFVYIIDGMLDIPGPAPGALNSFADAANSQGHVFCTNVISSNPLTGSPVVYSDGEWAELPGLEGYSLTVAGDLNDRGVAVGAGTVPTVIACMWLDGEVRNLNDPIPPNSGVFLKSGVKINNAGQVLCSADDSDNDDVGVLLTPVPINPADLDSDCQVGPSDLELVLNAWGQASGSAADLNDDGSVGVFDLAILLASWG